MDIQGTTIAGLTAIGIVNVVTMFFPDLDSRIKFALSAIGAFLVSLIPPDFGNGILNNLRDAIIIAFSASGVYKLAIKAGGE